MNTKFIITGLITSITNLILNAAAYLLILKDVYLVYPSGTEEFTKQLHRQAGELIIWAMFITSLAMGFLITTMIKWSGAKTFISGLKKGAILGFLFWASVNFGLYASSNLFSETAVFLDFACSATAMTISGAVAAWLSGFYKQDLKKSAIMI
jgi:hypothetical protein